MRLIDYLRAGPSLIPLDATFVDPGAWAVYEQGLHALARAATPVVADNIDDFVGVQMLNATAASKMPDLALPWKTFLVEWRPSGHSPLQHVEYLGALCEVEERQSSEGTIRYVIQGTTFRKRKNERTIGTSATYFTVSADANGVPLDHRIGVGEIGALHAQVHTVGNGGLYFSALGAMHAVYALGFCNCRNVTTAVQEPPPKLRKAVQRRRGIWLSSYHVIEINPVCKIARADPGFSTGPLSATRKALHLCRGSFKTYTQEAPLFGKHAGRFFFGQHMRGSRAHGERKASYVINLHGKG